MLALLLPFWLERDILKCKRIFRASYPTEVVEMNWLEAAVTYERQGYLNRAYFCVLQEKESSTDGHLVTADILHQEGQLEESRHQYLLALRRETNRHIRSAIYRLLSQCEWDLGLEQEAIESSRQASLLVQDHAEGDLDATFRTRTTTAPCA